MNCRTLYRWQRALTPANGGPQALQAFQAEGASPVRATGSAVVPCPAAGRHKRTMPLLQKPTHLFVDNR